MNPDHFKLGFIKTLPFPHFCREKGGKAWLGLIDTPSTINNIISVLSVMEQHGHC